MIGDGEHLVSTVVLFGHLVPAGDHAVFFSLQWIQELWFSANKIGVRVCIIGVPMQNREVKILSFLFITLVIVFVHIHGQT